MGRSPCCDKAAVKRGPWSPDEDDLLRRYIDKHGIGGNWIALPKKAGLRRCGKSCRLRWLNYLRPHIKHGGYTDEEDRLICALYGEIGSKWSVIASKLPGRTDNDVKNYWNTKLKKRAFPPAAAAAAGPSTPSASSSASAQSPSVLDAAWQAHGQLEWKVEDDAAAAIGEWDNLLLPEPDIAAGAGGEAGTLAAALDMPPTSYFPNMTEMWACAEHKPLALCRGLS